MTQDTIFRKGGDLYHGACLTQALKEEAEEIATNSLESDDICEACAEPLLADGGVEDLDEAEQVKEDGE